VPDIKKSMVLKPLNVVIPVFYITIVNLLDMMSIATVLSQTVQRSASILIILIRCLNPFILLLDKKELREIIYNKKTMVGPVWLEDIQSEIVGKRKRQNGSGSGQMHVNDTKT
jgi:hypothetical protein